MLSKLSGLYLIIDDDESMRCLLEVIIELAGGATRSAANAKEAIEIVRTHGSEISGILLDLNLEGAKGEDLYDEIARIEPQLNVFTMSGCHLSEIKERLQDRPITGLISKPFLSADLIATLANAAAQADQPARIR